MTHQSPLGYETKFANFIRMCEETKADGIKDIIVASYKAIGDTDEEMQESLARLADAGLTLHIAAPNN
jgi:hypothetical protein